MKLMIKSPDNDFKLYWENYVFAEKMRVSSVGFFKSE